MTGCGKSPVGPRTYTKVLRTSFSGGARVVPTCTKENRTGPLAGAHGSTTATNVARWLRDARRLAERARVHCGAARSCGGAATGARQSNALGPLRERPVHVGGARQVPARQRRGTRDAEAPRGCGARQVPSFNARHARPCDAARVVFRYFAQRRNRGVREAHLLKGARAELAVPAARHV